MSKKKKKKKLTPRQRKIRFGLKVALFVVLLIILIFTIVFYFKYGKRILELQAEANELVSESTVETFRQNQTTIVYDQDGNVLTKLKNEKDVYYLEYEDIPYNVKQAMISIEDKNFINHSGIDYKACLRAVVALIRNHGNITQGASTITQQLSRNIFLSHEVSWERKIKEIFIAMEMERKYEKYQILEFYLNNIYFANGYYGIQAASMGYFSKSVDELSLSEIAFLCAIPNNPTIYDPIDNQDNTLKRRDRILKNMLEDEKISQKDYDEAIDEEIKLKVTSITKHNYVDTYVIHCATEALMKLQGFEFQNQFESDEEKESYNSEYSELYSQCQQSLYTKGYEIYTSIDTDKQAELQTAVNDQLKDFTDTDENGTYMLQGSAVCIDNETGRVVAIVGGRDQDTSGYTLNRAYQSYRQPGSAIKPLNVYTPAFQLGYSPNQTVVDAPIKDGPKNADGRYSGKMTLRRAIEVSKNTTAYNIFDDIGPYVGMSFLYNMNFHRLAKDDYLLTASIGGFTNGVSAVEMASAYATIENDGEYRNPTCIVKVLDSDGNDVITDEIESKVVYNKNASRLMTDCLSGVITSGTAKGYGLTNQVSAGKTGTTSSNKDGWFVGYTPYYTTSVWVGYDTPKEMKNLKGNTYPLYIWHEYMESIHKDLDSKKFEISVDTSSTNKKEEKETATPSPSPTPEVTPTVEPDIGDDDMFDPDDLTSEDPDYWEATETPIRTKEPVVTPEPTVTVVPEPTVNSGTEDQPADGSGVEVEDGGQQGSAPLEDGTIQ